MHRYFYFLLLMITFISVQAYGWTPLLFSPNSDYVSTDIDGDYMVVERHRANRDAVLLYQVSTTTTTTIDDGTNSSYCDNSLDEVDPYDSTECSSFSCTGTSYDNLNIEGSYVTFTKVTTDYSCSNRGTYLTLVSGSSSSTVEVYNISSGNLSSISGSGSVSNLVMNGNYLTWIDNADVKMYDMSTDTGTESTILE